jgi:two-component system response regulator FixJ
MNEEPTVFIVDDEEAIRDSLSCLLQSVGLRAEAYRSARDFLRAYDPRRPGCLLLDIRMPGLSGLELQERINAAGGRTPIVVITGHADVASAVRAMKAGAIDLLEKPCSDEVLLDRVRAALEKDSEQRASHLRRAQVTSRLDHLTVRERQVLAMVVAGKANKVIAANLGISEKTVEVHRKRVMEKMGVRSVADLVRMTLGHEAHIADDPGKFAAG